MIIVCSLNDLETVCNSLKPKNLISVIDPGYEPETPSGVKNHLKLGFDDILEVRRDNQTLIVMFSILDQLHLMLIQINCS